MDIIICPQFRGCSDRIIEILQDFKRIGALGSQKDAFRVRSAVKVFLAYLAGRLHQQQFLQAEIRHDSRDCAEISLILNTDKHYRYHGSRFDHPYLKNPAPRLTTMTMTNNNETACHIICALRCSNNEEAATKNILPPSHIGRGRRLNMPIPRLSM